MIRLRLPLAVLGILLGTLDCASNGSPSQPSQGDDGGLDASVGDAHAGLDGSNPPTDGSSTGESGPGAGPDTTVDVFAKTPVFFGPSKNQRVVDQSATFPASGTYESITLHLSLTCPQGGCDVWDRFGTLAVVQPATTADGGAAERLVEIARFVTPYGLPAAAAPQPTWDLDVTELRPLLSGPVTLRVFIDTWVPQNVTNQGYGWQVTASFVMKGGVPAKVPVAVVPIGSWTTTNKEPTQVVYGDPSVPIAASLPTQQVALPAGASSFGVRSFITGHGQANLDNCAEFCSRQHTWTVGSTANKATVWRTDCASFPSSGTYQYPRAGWCPGANVKPWDFDVTAQVGDAGTIPFTYGVDAYVNTCNAGADGGGPCTGCAAGESCSYDGSGHTQPFYYVSAVLIAYR